MASGARAPKREPLQTNCIFLNDSDIPTFACADTGAEVSLLPTAVLDAAKISYDWDSLPDSPSICGLSAQP